MGDALRGLLEKHRIVEEPSTVPGSPAPAQFESCAPVIAASGARLNALRVAILYKANVTADYSLLQLLQRALAPIGCEVFYDKHLTIGVEWAREIEGKIRNADAAIVLLSESSIQSEMIAYEVEIAYESAQRLINPVPIAYGEAIAVAVLGLAVNLVSAWLLRDTHDHDHHDHDHHGHGHSDGHRHHDNNLRAAYVHVLADAATSVLAIAALVTAMYSQWVWADPAVGIVGSLVIASWAYGLIRDSGAVLLDVSADKNLEAVIRERLETKGDKVTDLHLWQVGPGHRAAVISVVSDNPLPPATYKRRLGGLRGLSHVTVEVELCSHAPEVTQH